jgi:hypothetical protein
MLLEPEPQEPNIFGLAETEPECIPSSGSVSDSGYGSGSDKWNKKVIKSRKIQKLDDQTTFWGTMLLLTMKRQDFLQYFFWYGNCAIYHRDPDLNPEPKLFQNRNRV